MEPAKLNLFTAWLKGLLYKTRLQSELQNTLLQKSILTAVHELKQKNPSKYENWWLSGSASDCREMCTRFVSPGPADLRTCLMQKIKK